MNWNLFWAIYVWVFAAACLIVAYAYGYRSTQKEKRCSVKTRGTVIRYSAAQYNGFSLPVVEYTANGKKYRVVGPHFKGGVKKNFSAPWNKINAEQESNIKNGEPLPDVIKVTRKTNSFVSVCVSPLTQRYPVGSEVDVFYDPQKPKRAFVERYAGTILFLSLWLPLVLGVILTALGCYFAFGPELVMQ